MLQSTDPDSLGDKQNMKGTCGPPWGGEIEEIS